ncbi:MAG: DNA primase small subunit PriS [Thermoplasmata archaeon]|nr:DNA primase small subunit PriS [Thermoplasmata archaeon]
MEELAFLRERFLGHYRANPPAMPPRFARREWGFMFFGGGYMMRHIAFATAAEASDFFLRKVPSHAYYSTAYYSEPGAQRMQEKGWLGADLIFDLDADHLPNAAGMTYEDQLAAVKPEMAKLLDDFILGDLGIGEEHVRLAFSGGRGYHLHVSHPGVVGLPSSARREIIDYVTGKGINLDTVLHKIAIGSKTKGRFTTDTFARRLDPSTASGWPGRITRGVLEELRHIQELNDGDAIAYLTGADASGKKRFEGIGKKRANEILARLRTIATWQDDVSNGIIDIFGDNFPVDHFIETVIEKVKVPLTGEADEPVTTDIKRLIRVPGSLHGKTGMLTVALTVDEFRAFDPLTDAIAFGDEEVRVNVVKETSVGLGGVTRRYPQGEASVPEYVAVFMIARRMATLPGNG